MRLKSVVDGKQVNIPVLLKVCDGGTQEDRLSGCWISQYKHVGWKNWQIRFSLRLRCDVETQVEVTDSMLPRKASKFSF